MMSTIATTPTMTGMRRGFVASFSGPSASTFMAARRSLAPLLLSAVIRFEEAVVDGAGTAPDGVLPGRANLPEGVEAEGGGGATGAGGGATAGKRPDAPFCGLGGGESGGGSGGGDAGNGARAGSRCDSE